MHLKLHSITCTCRTPVAQIDRGSRGCVTAQTSQPQPNYCLRPPPGTYFPVPTEPNRGWPAPQHRHVKHVNINFGIRIGQKQKVRSEPSPIAEALTTRQKPGKPVEVYAHAQLRNCQSRGPDGGALDISTLNTAPKSLGALKRDPKLDNHPSESGKEQLMQGRSRRTANTK